jgi:serine/threonine protein kinase
MLQGDSSWDDGPRVLRAGEQFGRYAIRGLVGRGAMGSVYRAYDTQLEREVALKIPDFDTTSDPEVLDRFVREAPAAAKIRHPNVCPIFDAGRIDDQYYLTMALIEGQTLVDWMKDRMVNPREAAELARKLARALEAVHAVGVVHRDLKASNVMIDRSGEPLLMDFGLARQSKADDPLTPNDSFLGTPAYMSPEQVNREPADARSDIYGVGVLFYQLLTGQLPFSGPLTKVMASIRHSEPPLPRLLNPNLDPQLEAICLKAMAKTPGDRYQSAAEMAEALQGYLEMPFETARPPSRRSPLIWIAAAGGDVLILAALAIRTGEGELELLVDQPGVTITIDGKPIQVSSPRDTLPVPIGDHVLVVRAKGFETRTVSFSIRWRWDAKQLEVRLDPVRRSSAFAENERPDAVIERWIETGARVMGIQISSDGSTLHAAYTEHPAPSRVQAFDVLSGRLLQTISFNDAGYDHHALALSGNQRYLYVTNYFRTDISQIDLQDRNSRRDMEIGGRWASAMGITPDGRLLVVPSGQDGRSEDEENDRVSILDLSNGRLSLNGQLTLNDEPVGHRLGFSADSK